MTYNLAELPQWASSEKHGLVCPGATAARLSKGLFAIPDATPYLAGLAAAASATYSVACRAPEGPDSWFLNPRSMDDMAALLRAIAAELVAVADTMQRQSPLDALDASHDAAVRNVRSTAAAIEQPRP